MGKGQRAFEHQLENPPSSPYVTGWELSQGRCESWARSPVKRAGRGCVLLSASLSSLHAWICILGGRLLDQVSLGLHFRLGGVSTSPIKRLPAVPATSQPPSLPASSSDLRREHGESISRVQVFFWCFQLLSLPKDGRFGMSEIVIVGLMLLIGWDLRIGVPWYTVFTCF